MSDPLSQNTPETNTEKKGNILKQYEDLSPINLVDTVERYYHTFLPSSNKESLHILSSYKSKTNVKFQLFDFNLKNNITYSLKPKIRKITCIRINGNYLILGEKDGSVSVYLIEEGITTKSFKPNDPNLTYCPTAIDVTPGLEYFLVGYSNGYISLWDGNTYNIVHTIKNVHKTKIFIVQFSSITDKKRFEILSTDGDGQLLKIILTIGFFKNNVEEMLIYKDNTPTYAITQFKPLKTNPLVLGAFSSINKVRIYILRPILNSFYEIQKPNFIKENYDGVPDISFGWGCNPIENNYDNEIKLSDKRENCIVLAVSWMNVITFYSMTVKGEDFVLNGDGPCSYFINNYNVIRIGFVSSSILYFFDESAQIKILNTAYTQCGEYIHDENKNNELKYNKNALVDEGSVIDKGIIRINVSTNPKKINYCYRYFINNMSKCIFLLTENGFYLGKVLNFQECIQTLTKSKNYLDAMCLGIDIFRGNITSFPDVPINMIERSKLLLPFLIDLLNQYIDFNLKDNENNKEDKKLKLIECMNVTIEFCIGIKDVDYLLKNVEETFRTKGKSDLFYKLMEPFIFNDLFNQENLSEDSVIALYTTYKANHELSLLSHIYTHLNLQCLSNATIKRLSIKENLFSLMILIYSNSDNYKDFFLPISKMYKVFCEIFNTNKFPSYAEMCGDNGIKDINIIENRIEYIGHKLLWYIDMSLKGNKFSLGMDVNLLKFDTKSNEYKTFIATIFYWILQDEIFIKLMKFDSYSFFNVLSQFFIDANVLKIIKNYEFKNIDTIFINEVTENKTKKSEEKNIDYNNPNSVINNIIIKLVEENKGFFIDIDFSLFLIKYASKSTELNPVVGKSKKYVVESVKKCLSFYDDYLQKKPDDNFKCHKMDKMINKPLDKTNIFYKEINKSLRDLFDSFYKWKKEEISELLEKVEKCPFILVKIKIYEIAKNYDECLKNYLNTENNEEFGDDVFTWMQKTFQSFSKKNEALNENDFKNLQTAVINNITKLSEISVPKTNKIIKQFYGNAEKINIIHKLDALPSLQYEFLIQLICPSKGGNLEELKINENNDDENLGEDNKNNESLCDLLLLQIDLLIKLKKNNEIFPSIKEQIITYPNLYPKKKCLQKCIDNNINDAAVFLYQSLGESDQALKLTKDNTEKAFVSYLENSNEENYKYFVEQLNLCIKICQDTSEKTQKEIKNNFNNNSKENNKINEAEKLWFDLLKSLYNFEKRSVEKKEVESKISQNIEDLLRKMCIHVSLQNIIENVTEMQKEAQYKEFKNILGDMLRSNNSLNRILKNTKQILQTSIIKYEVERNKTIISGNCYNCQKCDVCHKYFSQTKNEIISCFGCGHQSHKICINSDENNKNLECVICRRNGVEGGDVNYISNKNNQINVSKEIENNEKVKDNSNFAYGNRVDKIQKLKNYDQKYLENMIDMF